MAKYYAEHLYKSAKTLKQNDTLPVNITLQGMRLEVEQHSKIMVTDTDQENEKK
jgi:hypothetical protein